MAAIGITAEETPRYHGAPTTTPYRISTARQWLPVSAGGIAPAPRHLDRTNEARGNYSPPPRLIDGYDPTGRLTLRGYPNPLALLLHAGGLTADIDQGDGTNEVVTLTESGTISGGTYRLTFGGEQTAPIAYNATAAEVQTYLEGLPGILPGDVAVTGGPVDTTPLVLTFTGRYACTNVGAVTVDTASLTGSTPGITPSVTTPGATGSVTLLQGGGIEAGCYRIRFTKRTTSTAKTLQIDVLRPEHSFYQLGQGFGVTSIGWGADGEVSVDLMGLYVDAQPDPGLTPAFDALTRLPIRRGDLEVDWLSGGARIQDFSLTIANPLDRGENLAIPGYFPKILEHTGEPTMLSGSMTLGVVDPQDFDAAMTAETFAARAAWVTPTKIAATGTPYRVTVDMPACQLTGVEVDDVTNARRFGSTVEWMAAYDESAGYDFMVELVCAVSAVETYA